MKTSLPMTVANPVPAEQLRAVLPRIECRERKSAALHPSPMGHADVLSLNLTQGCAHRCGFCLARAYPTYPGDGVVVLFSDNLTRIRQELAARRQKPRAIYISPATDPFPPQLEVQAETAKVVQFLAEQGISSWLMTRGYIRPTPLRVLEAHREMVRVTVALTTLNRELQRVLEPFAAPPWLRLRQIAALKQRGIDVKVTLEPLMPGLTDTRENLEPLLEELAAVGVRHVTAGYVFLRQGIQRNLVRDLQPHGWDEVVLPAYHKGSVLGGETVAPARYLPKPRRQRGYSTLMALASRLGIRVSVSGLTNPDFQPAPRVALDLGARQMMLPMF
jgi:DNA repair photolyase